MREVYIEYKNETQVKWWNTVRRYVKIVDTYDIIDTATGKLIGTIFCVVGSLANVIWYDNLRLFINNPKLLTIEVD